MTKQTPSLDETLLEVFSLVSTDDALSARQEVIAHYRSGEGAVSGSVIWCDFQSDGKFLRAGVSDVGLMESRSILSKGDHPVVKEITQYAAIHGLQAGNLIPSEERDGFHWCIPYSAPSINKRPVHGLRTLLITEDLFLEVFDLFNIEDQLTPAEKRLVYQLISGLTTIEAAELDGVSIETKRSHLKRAMSKLGCTSQPAIMRLIVSQLIHVLYLCESETAQNRVIEAFTMDHLDGAVRLSSQRLPNGRLQRVWEMGPADGKPLLVLHGYLFPFLMLNAQDQLRHLGLRLVIPVRPGYLDEQDSARIFHEGRMIDQTLEDVEAFVRLTWSGPIDVLCHATGAYYAMMIAKKSPNLFSRLIVTSINLMNDNSDKQSLSASFLGGIRKLAKHNGMYEMLVRQFQKTTFSSDRATRFVLRRLFKESKTDLDALNGLSGHGEAFGWYQSLHAASMVGIASDFSLVSAQAGDALKDLSSPVIFLHGPDDCFTSVDEMKTYIELCPMAEIKVLHKGGHIAISIHATLFWAQIDDVLAG
jgi:pimeloyl-ACP methyl ester carboxylesterase/DNA-binding CsgD family transcriptional regulator